MLLAMIAGGIVMGAEFLGGPRPFAFGPPTPLPLPCHGTPWAINDAKGAVAT